jgi:hypothetical protein
MLTVKECRQHAEDCVRQIQTAIEPHRATLLGLAQAWLQLADEAEAFQGKVVATTVAPAPKHS